MNVRTEVRAGLLNGKGAQVHPLMYVVAAAFALYFVAPLIERRLQ